MGQRGGSVVRALISVRKGLHVERLSLVCGCQVAEGPHSGSLCFLKIILFLEIFPPIWPLELGWGHFTLNLVEQKMA